VCSSDLPIYIYIYIYIYDEIDSLIYAGVPSWITSIYIYIYDTMTRYANNRQACSGYWRWMNEGTTWLRFDIDRRALNAAKPTDYFQNSDCRPNWQKAANIATVIKITYREHHTYKLAYRPPIRLLDFRLFGRYIATRTGLHQAVAQSRGLNSVLPPLFVCFMNPTMISAQCTEYRI